MLRTMLLATAVLATAALYAVFLCIAAWGWDNWRRAAPE